MLLIQSGVRTKQPLSGAGFIAPRESKRLRKPNTIGIVIDIRQGLVLVQHPGDKGPAIYRNDELLEEPTWYRVEHSTRESKLYFFKEFTLYEEVLEYLFENGVDDSDASVSGPFFGLKELEEGFEAVPGLYDHLLKDDLFR